MDNYNIETILNVHHWSDNLFSFTCTRNKKFKFINGEFTLIGIIFNKKILTKAYSIVSSNEEDYLEFFSIKVKDGLLTSKLQYLKKGDELLVGKKPTGTLLVNNLCTGENLWLISSGTGIAPFLSLIKNINIYSSFKNIILIHTVRYSHFLCYRYYITEFLFKKKFFNKFFKNILYYPSLTNENFFNVGRITNILNNYKIFNNLKLKLLDKSIDKVMLCGSVNMLKDCINLLKNYDFKEAKNAFKADYVIERSFVD